MNEYEIFKKTVFAEARGEPREAQVWVAWVIKNRANLNREYWGGSTIRGVCLHPGQFECWNGRNDITIPPNERNAYDGLDQWLEDVYHAPANDDPTQGCDHYNNLAKEGKPAWTRNVTRIRIYGNHHFYRSNN